MMTSRVLVCSSNGRNGDKPTVGKKKSSFGEAAESMSGCAEALGPVNLTSKSIKLLLRPCIFSPSNVGLG